MVFAESIDKLVRFTPQIDYGKLRLQPGQKENLETLAVGVFDDARLGLGKLFDCRQHGIDRVDRHHDRAVAVGVNEIAALDCHAGDLDFDAEIDRMHIGM